MKKLIVFGALGLLLAGGGGAAFMMMSGGESAEAPGVAEAVEPPSEPIYMRMEGLTAPIMRTNKIRHYIFLNVTMEMASNDARDEAMKLKPRLNDAFLREFYSRSVTERNGSGRIDFDALKQRLVKQANGVLGDGQVLDVLVTRAMRGAG